MIHAGLVPPVYEEGDLLVDGGYLNNIPVDVMRSLGVGTGDPPIDRECLPWHVLCLGWWRLRLGIDRLVTPLGWLVAAAFVACLWGQAQPGDDSAGQAHDGPRSPHGQGAFCQVYEPIPRLAASP